MRRLGWLVIAAFAVSCNSAPAFQGHLAKFRGSIILSVTTPLTKAVRSLRLGWRTVGTPGQFVIADVLTYGGKYLKVSPPAGWALIREDTASFSTARAASPIRQFIYWHIIQPNDIDANGDTWQFSERVEAQGSVIFLDNVSTIAPVDATSGYSRYNTAYPLARSVTTTRNGDLVLYFYATDFLGGGLNPRLPCAPGDLKAREFKPLPRVSGIVSNSDADYEYWVDAAYQTTQGKTPDAVSVTVQFCGWIAAQVALRMEPARSGRP
ncbi:MAG: hypothetical protein ACREQI_12005 [Candidatus Binataceae bacterium]